MLDMVHDFQMMIVSSCWAFESFLKDGHKNDKSFNWIEMDYIYELLEEANSSLLLPQDTMLWQSYKQM